MLTYACLPTVTQTVLHSVNNNSESFINIAFLTVYLPAACYDIISWAQNLLLMTSFSVIWTWYEATIQEKQHDDLFNRTYLMFWLVFLIYETSNGQNQSRFNWSEQLKCKLLHILLVVHFILLTEARSAWGQR